MIKNSLVALCAVVVASTAFAFVGSRISGASNPSTPTSPLETPGTVSWSKGTDDGSAVFHLTIYAPWIDANQRTIAFYSGYLTTEGLAALDGTRISETMASNTPLEAAGERFKCTARLNQVGSWAEVRTRSDVILEVTPVEPVNWAFCLFFGGFVWLVSY